jgi:hypothetical protein
MTTILKNIKKRLLIILGISLRILTFALNWMFIIPCVISLALAHEANEFDFIDF